MKQNGGRVGKVKPPLEVKSKNDIDKLESLISIGPMTVVVVVADWCGHCQKFKKDIWPAMTAVPNRTVNTAMIPFDQVENTSLRNAKIDGYPSVLVVGKDNIPVNFDNTGNNAGPNSYLETMTALMEKPVDSENADNFLNINSVPASLAESKANSLGYKNSFSPDPVSALPPDSSNDFTRETTMERNQRGGNTDSLLDSLTRIAAGGSSTHSVDHLLPSHPRKARRKTKTKAKTNVKSKRKTRNARKTRKTRRHV